MLGQPEGAELGLPEPHATRVGVFALDNGRQTARSWVTSWAFAEQTAVRHTLSATKKLGCVNKHQEVGGDHLEALSPAKVRFDAF